MIFDKDKLLFIAGPCSLENENICRAVAETLLTLCQRHQALNLVFKGSYDKANRTSFNSPRGPGLEDGLSLLATVKKDYGFPVLTDVHEVAQVAPTAEVCDVLQIPAFLCRQTDLLVTAAQANRTINIKKGQFLSPAEMKFAVEKLEKAQAVEIWQTERGFTFGYQNLVVDMRSFSILKSYGHPAIFDATHSVQLPGAGGGKTAGQREFLSPLARASLAAGADGLFVETHPNPARAISDGPNQVPLAELPALAEKCLQIWQAVRE